ncbi:hypothetical protein BDZ89DRAFT_1158541 [Hymenopellis radicata]|nr:hypothetical protein BDZ89DRAFT_1158541 [Hymenopellis radicata]
MALTNWHHLADLALGIPVDQQTRASTVNTDASFAAPDAVAIEAADIVHNGPEIVNASLAPYTAKDSMVSISTGNTSRCGKPTLSSGLRTMMTSINVMCVYSWMPCLCSGLSDSCQLLVRMLSWETDGDVRPAQGGRGHIIYEMSGESRSSLVTLTPVG